MLHILYGSDEFQVSEALRALRGELDPEGMLSTNTSTLAGRGLTPDQLIQHAAAVPFLGDTRLVLVEGLLHALGSRRGVVESWQKLIDFLPQMPQSSHVVLVEIPPARDSRDAREGGVGRSPLLRALRELPGVDVREFRELRAYARGGEPSEAGHWLHARARERSLAIEPAAIDALVDLIGGNLRMLATELEKLAAYAGARPITSEDVRLLTPQAREESVFALVDAVVEGRGAVALRVLAQILEDAGQAPIALQAMLARQFRHLVRATELLESHSDEAAIGAATGVRNSFALGKLVRQARATTRTAAEAGLRELERSDQLVKTGKLNDALALELLTLRLASIAANSRGGRGARAAARSR
jgi:DNA polymerase-3 subunit delta